MLIGFFVGLAAVTGVCVYLIERVDRPLRRAERLAPAVPAGSGNPVDTH
jgi:hypothetical protein